MQVVRPLLLHLPPCAAQDIKALAESFDWEAREVKLVGWSTSWEMADTSQEAEELENWIDDTREKIFKVKIS